MLNIIAKPILRSGMFWKSSKEARRRVQVRPKSKVVGPAVSH